MPIQAWVTIGCFIAGIMWSVAVWLAGRRVKRIDDLEKDVNGPDGLRRHVDRLITRDEFAEAHEDLETMLKGLNEEGQAREQRIRDHVDTVRRSGEQDLRDIRRELSDLHKRIDSAMRGRR